MADKTATVRFDVKGDGFRSGMNQAKQQVVRGSKEMGAALQSGMNAGAKAGVDSIRSMLGAIKTAALSLGGLFGGLGMAELVRGSIDSRKQFRNLSAAIEAGSGRIIKWQTLQQQSRMIANRWGQDNERLGQSFSDMFTGTKDLNFTANSLETIAIAARGTGAEVEGLSKIAGVLNQKFGITARELPDAMADVIGAAQAMGPGGLEKLADDFGEIGGKAKSLGLQGSSGMKQMLGWLAVAQRETGRFEQAMTALPQIFDQILERTGKGGVLTSGGKLPITIQTLDQQGRPRSPADIVADIISKTGGQAEALGEFGFGGEGLQTIMALAKDFQAEMKTTGGDIDAARAAVARALEDAATSSMDWSRIQARAAEAMKDPEANITTAINKMKESFEDPAMQDAIGKLAENLPTLAEAVANAVEFITKNPIMSAGVLMGGASLRGGLGAGMGGLAGAFDQGGKTAAGAIEQALQSGGATAADSIKKSLGGLLGGAAPALAVGGVTAAVDQASKLIEDIDEMEKDAQRQREEALANAERQGDKYATRQVSLAERLLSGEKGRPEDVFAGETERIMRDPKTGKAIAVPEIKRVAAEERVKYRITSGYSAEDQRRIAQGLDPLGERFAESEGLRGSHGFASRAEAERWGLYGGEMQQRAESMAPKGFDWDAFDKRMAQEKAGGAAKPSQQMDQLRAAVEAGPKRTLRVELTNADAIGEAVASRGGAKPGTPPAAGYTGG